MILNYDFSGAFYDLNLFLCPVTTTFRFTWAIRHVWEFGTTTSERFCVVPTIHFFFSRNFLRNKISNTKKKKKKANNTREIRRKNWGKSLETLSLHGLMSSEPRGFVIKVLLEWVSGMTVRRGDPLDLSTWEGMKILPLYEILFRKICLSPGLSLDRWKAYVGTLFFYFYVFYHRSVTDFFYFLLFR